MTRRPYAAVTCCGRLDRRRRPSPAPLSPARSGCGGRVLLLTEAAGRPPRIGCRSLMSAASRARTSSVSGGRAAAPVTHAAHAGVSLTRHQQSAARQRFGKRTGYPQATCWRRLTTASPGARVALIVVPPPPTHPPGAAAAGGTGEPQGERPRPHQAPPRRPARRRGPPPSAHRLCAPR